MSWDIGSFTLSYIKNYNLELDRDRKWQIYLSLFRTKERTIMSGRLSVVKRKWHKLKTKNSYRSGSFVSTLTIPAIEQSSDIPFI